MKCEACGHKTKVIDSRNSDSTASFRGQNLVREHVSWYTNEWVCRRRKCPNCNLVAVTVELLLDDLNNGWERKS